jgi:hypothetical protein
MISRYHRSASGGCKRIAVLDEVAPPERPAEAFAWLAILYGAACAATAAAWLVTSARAKTLSALRARP